MSRSVDDFEFHAEQLFRKSKTNPLRERMRQFVDNHSNGNVELKEKRADIAGDSLSETVIEGRDERI